MDFRTVLNLLIDEFDKEHVGYALIGGFALGVLGVPRATIDIDLLIYRDDWLKVDGIMKKNGYACVHKSDEVAQYVSALNIFGEVDFLLAHRNIARKMLENADAKEAFAGKQKVKVLKAEDVIGLKIQALVNNADRATKEYADIESLLGYYKKDLDWVLLEDYFKLFGLEDKYSEYKTRFLC